MPVRAIALAVLVALATTTLAGFECLWDCPPAATAAQGHCHESAKATAPSVGAAHDCGDHSMDAAPATLTGRSALLEAAEYRAASAPLPLRVSAPRTGDTRGWPDSPPVGFLTPLRL